ncbi:MAG: hypothetical protein GY869_04095 [Planctomycetes bacterium]|nr:hypothetical protein [Planctomycetota bacterium]
MKRYTVAFVFIFMLFSSAHAQIAAPYLDYNRKSIGPAAVGWKPVSIAGIYGGSITESEVNGNKTLDKKPVKMGEIDYIGNTPEMTLGFSGEAGDARRDEC